VKRRYSVGAECFEGGVDFRVWAPDSHTLDLLLEGRVLPMRADEGGYFSLQVEGVGHGARYRLRPGGGDPLPDPASRAQPEGPHGPSCVIDPRRYVFRDQGWGGVGPRGQIVYEMHVGTFTREGAWAAAAEQLPELARLGVTVVEMMPICEFPGEFGWGYDGVDLWAPSHLYGAPDDLRAFVDRAHAVGVAVILDVVYNHLGPDGNYLAHFGKAFFHPERETEWGRALNFDREGSAAVRAFFCDNAAYWIEEFHFDGLRFDATQSIFDDSKEHVLAEMARRAREAAAPRAIYLVAENEPQHTRLVRPPAAGGMGLDALWNDDFHHSAVVALTGRAEAYYTDTRGSPQEFISAAKWGYLFQGQHYTWQKKGRGTPGLDLPPEAFIAYLENHDQVANTATGERLHRKASPARFRAMTALLLLGPWTPMLFQGQEFSASNPFLYFADHGPDLAKLVQGGRAEFLTQFPSLTDPEIQARLAPPHDRRTFERCKLDFAERETHAEAYALHADLIALRRRDPVFHAPRRRGVDGAVLGPAAFALRFFGEEHGDRLCLFNLGAHIGAGPAPEPLLAPPEGQRWKVLWTSESPRYGGAGGPPPETKAGLRLHAESCTVLTSTKTEDAHG
jgi:maltooligosyltrehalose trehalohydrolase